MSNELSADYDLRHLMRDVVIMLGGRKDIADLLDKSQDGISDADVEKLRTYAIELFTANKERMRNLHKISIEPIGNG
jgi:hypothetical protein